MWSHRNSRDYPPLGHDAEGVLPASGTPELRDSESVALEASKRWLLSFGGFLSHDALGCAHVSLFTFEGKNLMKACLFVLLLP